MIQFNDFIAVPLLDYAAAGVVLILACGLVYKFYRWSKVIPSGFFGDVRESIGTSSVIATFWIELVSSAVMMRKVINNSRLKSVSHILALFGFYFLAIATIWDDLFFNSGTLPAPFSIDNIGNIVGNVGGVMVLIGVTVMFARYISFQPNKLKGDMFFIIVLYAAVITGFVTELFRYWGAELPTFGSYAIHLAMIAALLISAPFTHFFHAVLTPFMRYVERLRVALASKKGLGYLGDRYSAMTQLSSVVKSGQLSVTPTWLMREKKQRE